MNLFFKIEPLLTRYRFLSHIHNNGIRFSSSFKHFSTLSYLNFISDSEKSNRFSNLDLNDCLSSGKYESFSRFVDNYRNIVHNLSYNIQNVESFFRADSDQPTDLDYELLGGYAYYLKQLNGSTCLCRTLMKGYKRRGKSLDLEKFILENGKVVLNFSELSERGINNVKNLRISPNGDFISVLYDPDFNDNQKLVFYSITKNRFFNTIFNDIGEIFLMKHHQNNRFTRLYYTQLNSNKRSCKLFTSLIHNRSGTICSKLLIYDEPVHFISLFKSKNGEVLFMATTSYNKVFSSFMIDKRLKLYSIPTANDKKTMLEYRNNIIYRIYSGKTSQISMISTRRLKPYRSRFNELKTDHHLESSSIKLDYTVSDIDMFNKGLVLYLFKPPSTPMVAVLPFQKKNMNLLKRPENDKESQSIKFIEIPTQVGVVEPSTNMNYYSNCVKFSINSPGLSDVRIEYNLDTHLTKINSDKTNTITSFVLEVPSRDGSCKIPATIISKSDGISSVRDIVRRKCMLYVYGFYGENLKVCNYIEHNPLLEMGYVLCFAHVRGGGELGEEWHKMGSKSRKYNSFYDLVDVIKHLIGKNITTSSLLALNVSSASGILGGCIYNMVPNLCSVIIFKLPYLDLLTTVMDPSNPLVELEYEEFGNTLDDIQMLEHVYSLDPCNNVRVNDLKKPALIINCDENDIRAPWYHTAKFVTLINQNHDNDNIFVKISSHGHDGCPPDDYLIRTCSEYISIIDHFICKNTQNTL